jgi:hypothetical protein
LTFSLPLVLPSRSILKQMAKAYFFKESHDGRLPEKQSELNWR